MPYFFKFLKCVFPILSKILLPYFSFNSFIALSTMLPAPLGSLKLIKLDKSSICLLNKYLAIIEAAAILKTLLSPFSKKFTFSLRISF